MPKREGGAATTQQIFFCSPGYLEQRENIQEIMSIVTGVASVVGYVNKGIASVIVETKDNISRHAHAICNKNELIQKRCQQILSLPGRAANALTSLNGAMESIGQRAEKKITQFCNQNPGNKKLRHRAGIFFQSMACAIEQSELPVQPQVYLQLLNKTSNSTALSDMAHTVDSQWNLRLGTTQDFLSNATLVAMSMNFPGKGSSLFTQWVKSIPAKLKASVKFESRLSTQQLVYTSKAAEAKAVEAEVKAIASNLKYADNPTYKRRFGESQKVEALKVKALEHKKANGLIGLEQRVAHQQTLAHGYKQDRILLSQLAKEQPLQLPEQLRQALQQPEFISRMQYTSSSLLRARIGDNNVHYILHVYSKSSIASALQHTSSHSGRNFLAFDPQTHALQDVHAALGGLSKTVVGVGKLPRGEFTSFIVIEIK